MADGAAAIAFYGRAFAAQELGEQFTGPDGELIRAEIRIGDSVVMITEDAVDGPVRSPERLAGMVTRVMSTYWEDVGAAWERAVSAGAEVIYPLAGQFYGERGGRATCSPPGPDVGRPLAVNSRLVTDVTSKCDG